MPRPEGEPALLPGLGLLWDAITAMTATNGANWHKKERSQGAENRVGDKVWWTGVARIGGRS